MECMHAKKHVLVKAIVFMVNTDLGEIFNKWIKTINYTGECLKNVSPVYI